MQIDDLLAHNSLQLLTKKMEDLTGCIIGVKYSKFAIRIAIQMLKLHCLVGN